MEQYNPLKGPEPKDWFSIEEPDRVELVQLYHKKHKIKLPNKILHALCHVIVETQVALGDKTPVKNTLKRLIIEGLNRHDAIHAIGSVLMSQIYDIAKSESEVSEPSEDYYSRLESLTAAMWLSQAENQ